ncbi:MAG: type III pantothenate kinase [Fulvivirga sp.]|nr:type III pantothenate kinase [Fulvivirga sp.]
MLLAADIGNTQIVFGLHVQNMWEVYRVDTDINDELENLLPELIGEDKLKKVSQCLMSSVVPDVTSHVNAVIMKHCNPPPLVIGPDMYDALPIKIANPTEVGTDLVCNSVAGHHKFKGDCLVVDFGTALTFTVIEKNKLSGVNIAPGLRTSMKALIKDAAQLDEIPLRLPPSVIGHDTTSAIQSGILWGYVGLVERMIDRINDTVGHELKVVATGGLSEVLAPLRDKFDEVDKNLTLEGIRLVGSYNS